MGSRFAGSSPVLTTKIKHMFRTLKYVWGNFQKRPSRRSFLIFIKMMKTEIRCLLMTGYSTDELLN
jgi:hypothetical protein